MSGGDCNLHWARRLVAGLVGAGIRRAVISPGSRSTPLALAAATAQELTVDVLVDERTAGFFALGQARASCRPSLLICTSGTAGAHYLPAVVEASQASLPMVVLTADRPPELHERGALQTVSQMGLFGTHVRATLDLGTPSQEERALLGVERAAAVAVARSLDPRPGPVHLNAPFRAPLEPASLPLDLEPLSPPPRFFPPRRVPPAEAVQTLAQVCREARRGVILAGPLRLGEAVALPAALALSRRLGFPLLAEAASQLRFSGAGEAVIGLFELLAPPLAGSRLRPDLVLQVGAFPTSMSWGKWLASEDACPRWVVVSQGWGDPTDRAAGVVVGDVDLVLAALVQALGEGEPAEPLWAARWQRAQGAVRAVLAEAEAQEGAAGHLSESGAVRAVLAAVPEGGLLAVANSLAIREVDLACPPELARVGVLAQRGASGIDGTVSAAAGAASVAPCPVTAVLGDLAFLHDLGGLATCRHARQTLVLVVLANQGGRIFDLLPLADGRLERRVVEELFVAGQAVGVSEVAAGFGLPYRLATTGPQLHEAVAEAHRRGGVSVIEARIAGAGARERRAGWQAAVAARLAEVAG